mgnify:CR=1 FL=1
MKANKIILGTAHFGMKYGINKRELELNEIKKILKFAQNNNIKYLDTALSYKNAMIKLSKVNLKNWRIISKIPSKPKFLKDISEWIEKIIYKTCNDLNINKIDTLLIHDEKNILDRNDGKKIFAKLRYYKDKGLIENIGCSIYTPQKVKHVLNDYDFDIIQCPYNIFDKRLVRSGLLKMIEKKKIKLHLRSIFLQGLLLKKNNFPKNFRTTRPIKKLSSWLNNNNYRNISACLAVLNEIKFDKLVVGVDNVAQIKDILINSKSNIKVPVFKINDKSKLIHPRKW